MRIGSALPCSQSVRQPLAQLARVVANNVVFECAIIRRPIEDLYADLMLRDFVSAACEGFRHHKEEKLRQQGRAREVRPGDDALRKFPMRIVLQTERPRVVRAA